jgi:hypothetical protein
MKHFILDYHYPGQDSNPSPSGCTSEALPFETAYSVFVFGKRREHGGLPFVTTFPPVNRMVRSAWLDDVIVKPLVSWNITILNTNWTDNSLLKDRQKWMYTPTRNKNHLRLACSHCECQGQCFLKREARMVKLETAFRNREFASTLFYIEDGIWSFFWNIGYL